jgi:hypothetical protein
MSVVAVLLLSGCMESLEVQVPESYGVAIHVQDERDPACVGQEAARTGSEDIEDGCGTFRLQLCLADCLEDV